MSGVILGAKLDQSQQFDEQGRRIVVTHITTSPCYIIRVKQGKNNNVILKLGFGLSKSTKKPQLGEMQKAGIKAPLHFLKEMLFPIGDAQIIEEDKKRGIAVGEQKLMEGDELKPNIFFKKDDVVSVIGISKGKGFQGGVKRHGFAGGPKTHGQSDRHRAPGSIG
ncbi:MAG: 50S ribosomal protein L3, partial [Patescibacteria group bacterium]